MSQRSLRSHEGVLHSELRQALARAIQREEEGASWGRRPRLGHEIDLAERIEHSAAGLQGRGGRGRGREETSGISRR